MEEWGKILQGGGILGGLALAAKLILPVLSKQSEASTSRLETDTTLHEMLQENLRVQQALAKELSAASIALGAMEIKLNAANAKLEMANTRIEELTRKVGVLTADLEEARRLLSEAGVQIARRSTMEVKP